METLKLLCQCIAPIQNTEVILAEINSPDFEWEPVIYCSGQHLVTPALYFYLKKKKIFPLLNQELRDYLGLIYDLNLSRNKKIKEQLLALLPVLNTAGIEPLLLKGIASLLGELYESPGIRVLGDIDILVSKDKLNAAKNILLAQGYTFTPFRFQDIVGENKHLPAFIHNDQPVAIEIHRHPVALKHSEWVNNLSAWKNSTQIFLKTGVVRLPTLEFRLLHNFCHCQIGDRGYLRGYINVRQLFEWVKLRKEYEGEIDWIGINKKVDKCRSFTAWGGYLLSAEKYFSQPLVANTKLPFLTKFFMHRLKWNEKHEWSWKINLIVDWTFYYTEKIMLLLFFNFQRGPRAFIKTIKFLFIELFSLNWLKEKIKLLRHN